MHRRSVAEREKRVNLHTRSCTYECVYPRTCVHMCIRVQVHHALDLRDDGTRWKGNVWILTHVVIIVMVVALGKAMNNLLLPFDGYPDVAIGSMVRERALICTPVSVILLMLTLQHGLHKGGGRGTRRIGRRKRLLFRVLTSFLILVLPLFALFASDELDRRATTFFGNATCQEVGIPLITPPMPALPALATRRFYLSLLLTLLFCQMILEIFGRGYAQNTRSHLVAASHKQNFPATPRQYQCNGDGCGCEASTSQKDNVGSGGRLGTTVNRANRGRSAPLPDVRETDGVAMHPI